MEDALFVITRLIAGTQYITNSLHTSIKIKPELKRNIFNFGYGINYKYEGMLAHLFDRFYMVTKFILPSIAALKFSTLNYDNT